MWPGPLPLCCVCCAFPQVESSRFLKIPQDSPFGPLRGLCGEAGAPGPPLFFVFCFPLPPAPFRPPGPPLTERSKTHGPFSADVAQDKRAEFAALPPSCGRRGKEALFCPGGDEGAHHASCHPPP